MQDLILNTDKDIEILNGDFVIEDCDTQNKELLLICNKGAFKETPQACVGLWNYLESEDKPGLVSEIKTQFRADGMEVSSVDWINGKLAIEAKYQ